MGLFFTGKSTDKSILAFIQGPFLYTRYPVMNYYGRVLMNFLLSTYLNQRDKVIYNQLIWNVPGSDRRIEMAVNWLT